MHDAKKCKKRDQPIACTLSGPELAGRRRELEEIFDGCLKTGDIEDGYEFLFPGNGDWAARLTELVVFEPEDGPIRLRGPEGAKVIVAEMFASRAG